MAFLFRCLHAGGHEGRDFMSIIMTFALKECVTLGGRKDLGTGDQYRIAGSRPSDWEVASPFVFCLLNCPLN